MITTEKKLRVEAEKVAQVVLGPAYPYDALLMPDEEGVNAILAFGQRERLDTLETAIILAENVPLSNLIDPGSIRLDILGVLRAQLAALERKAG